jgi:hypothetical protein
MVRYNIETRRINFISFDGLIYRDQISYINYLSAKCCREHHVRHNSSKVDKYVHHVCGEMDTKVQRESKKMDKNTMEKNMQPWTK